MVEPKRSGRTAVKDETKQGRADRVRALREALDLTQQQVADESRGAFLRTDVVKIESGKTPISSIRMAKGLARAFGILVDDLIAYLDAEIDRAEVRRRRTQGAPRGLNESPGIADWLRAQLESVERRTPAPKAEVLKTRKARN